MSDITACFISPEHSITSPQLKYPTHQCHLLPLGSEPASLALTGVSGTPTLLALIGVSGTPTSLALIGVSGTPTSLALTGVSGTPTSLATTGVLGTPTSLATTGVSGTPVSLDATGVSCTLVSLDITGVSDTPVLLAAAGVSDTGVTCSHWSVRHQHNLPPLECLTNQCSCKSWDVKTHHHQLVMLLQCLVPANNVMVMLQCYILQRMNINVE